MFYEKLTFNELNLCMSFDQSHYVTSTDPYGHKKREKQIVIIIIIIYSVITVLGMLGAWAGYIEDRGEFSRKWEVPHPSMNSEYSVQLIVHLQVDIDTAYLLFLLQ